MSRLVLITNKFSEGSDRPGPGGALTVQNDYCKAIAEAGGTPIISALGSPRDYAELADGVLFTGGVDISPEIYGAENRHSVNVDPGLDNMELEIFAEFYKRKKPILGICRGIQFINVALGGDLIQDIHGETGSVHTEPSSEHEHYVNTVKGSAVNKLLGDRIYTNSFHHQAVNRLGDGLTVTARADDGIIEAVEHESLPIIGVQWHPERMLVGRIPELDGMEALFEYFVGLTK